MTIGGELELLVVPITDFDGIALFDIEASDIMVQSFSERCPTLEFC